MQLLRFDNNEFGSIRTISIDNQPWFVGKDVAECLGYSNPAKAIRDHVETEDKGVNEMFTPGGKQDLQIINESGLYSLIMSSKLPKAKEFKHWITSEVLPSIRKNGMYATDQLLDNPDLAIAVFTQLKEERERRRCHSTRLRQRSLGKSRRLDDSLQAFSADSGSRFCCYLFQKP